jgi:23S rRNA (adenine1618-N6)-methyltransferase
LNFGGQNNELWVKGGEETFVREMAKESQLYGKNCFWFTTLVAKKANLASIYRMLHSLNPVEVKTITMAQGQKESRIVAWTFLSETEQQDWIQKRWKATK